MRLALVVQRYGEEIAGGAELHARYVAEMLARRHEVTVYTTTARDYLTWENHYPAGEERLGGVRVRRFRVERPRVAERFALAQRRAFAPGHSLADEEAYLQEQGPWAPELWSTLARERLAHDALIAFSYRYVTTQKAAAAMPGRMLLVPTAERDPAVGLETTRALVAGARAIAWNSEEEREMLARETPLPPGEVVGIGSRIPARTDPRGLRARFALADPYVLYLGRIDRNKGCLDLFRYFAAFCSETGRALDLVLIGAAVLEIPRHPRLRHLGFVSEQDKYDALAGSEVLLMPSEYESLSMVTLEAMALGVPPLVNGRCEVLRGQMRRSNAGLWYEGYEEFFEALKLLLDTPRLRQLLGRKGQTFYADRYRDDVIAAKYERLLAGLAAASGAQGAAAGSSEASSSIARG